MLGCEVSECGRIGRIRMDAFIGHFAGRLEGRIPAESGRNSDGIPMSPGAEWAQARARQT